MDGGTMIDGLPLLYWRRNLGKSGQDSMLRNMLNAIRLCNPRFTKSHTYLHNIVSLEKRIAYDFGRDRTTAQLCSCLTRHTTAKVKVQIEWQNQVITYDATKMYGIDGQP